MIYDVPSEELISSLKEKYVHIYQVTYEEQVYIYREVSRAEYNEISTYIYNEVEIEDVIVELCVLYPENYNAQEQLPGITTNLAENILRTSELLIDQIVENLDFFRGEMEMSDHQIIATIKEVFPEYHLEEIESWHINRLLKYLSRAEWILRNLRGVNLSVQEANSAEEEIYTEEVPQQPIYTEPKQEHQFTIKSTKNFEPVEKHEIPDEEIKEENDNTPRLSDELEDKVIDGVSRSDVRNRMKNLKLSEEDILNMFNQSAQASGRGSISNEITQIGAPIPEAAWFKSRSDLTGED